MSVAESRTCSARVERRTCRATNQVAPRSSDASRCNTGPAMTTIALTGWSGGIVNGHVRRFAR